MLSLSTRAEVPVTADGCQTMNSDCPASPADSKISVPIHARRLDAKVGAFPRVVLLEDVSGIGVRSVGSARSAISSAKTRAALVSESATPASFRIAAMCA